MSSVVGLLFLRFFENLPFTGIWIVFLEFNFTLDLLAVLAGVVHIVRLGGLELNEM